MMAGKEFGFNRCEFRPWLGRYGRVQGRGTAFRIKHTAEHGWWPIIEWETAECKLVCLAKPSREVESLVEAINDGKEQLFGSQGGVFVINEYGQVIVPSSAGDGSRLLVGETQGVLFFDNPYNGEMLDLSDNNGLKPGDLWNRPYLGGQYNLSTRSSVYYWNTSGSQYLPEQDPELIKNIRSVRRTGPVRILVNPYGIVLTKNPVGEYNPDEDSWAPVYVGRINLDYWFEKEE